MDKLIEIVKSYLSLDERKQSIVIFVFSGFGVIGFWKFSKYGVIGLDSNYTAFMLGLGALILGASTLINKNNSGGNGSA